MKSYSIISMDNVIKKSKPVIEIKEVTSKEIEVYKKLILKGLVEDEDCFRIAPEDEYEAPFPTNDQSDSFTIGAFKQNKLIGTASFKREGSNRLKLRHKGLLFKIYVDQEFRQKGIASSLIQEVINRAMLLRGIEQINLTVIPTNKYAKKLYEKFGFETFASEKKAVKWKGKYFDEDQMKLLIKKEDETI